MKVAAVWVGEDFWTMPQWAWITIGLTLIVGLFAFLLTLGRDIEPDDRELHNDSWIKKGSDSE
jgi:hypothetical protein